MRLTVTSCELLGDGRYALEYTDVLGAGRHVRVEPEAIGRFNRHPFGQVWFWTLMHTVGTLRPQASVCRTHP